MFKSYLTDCITSLQTLCMSEEISGRLLEARLTSQPLERNRRPQHPPVRSETDGTLKLVGTVTVGSVGTVTDGTLGNVTVGTLGFVKVGTGGNVTVGIGTRVATCKTAHTFAGVEKASHNKLTPARAFTPVMRSRRLHQTTSEGV